MMSNTNIKQLLGAPTSSNAMTNMQHLMKGDRNLFMSSDDNVTMKQVHETHNPDGRSLNVRPILHIVEDIFARTRISAAIDANNLQGTHLDRMEDKTYQANVTSMLEALSHIIDRISCELSIKSLSGTAGHATAISILQMVSSYPWDAKLVLTVAAFALSYGEFWLLAQIFSSNQLARSMAILKQVPLIMEHAGTLQPRFDAVSNLLNAVMDLTRTIVALEELPPSYIPKDVPEMTAAKSTIPTAVYWNIRSVVACATQISCLTSMGYEYTISMTELAWELATLAQRINQIHEHLKRQLDICHQHIDEKIKVEAYESLKQLFNMTHMDNMKILKALIYPKDDLPPLVEGSTKRRVNLDVLRRKSVLLLISGLDISHDELSILEQIYSESRLHGTRMESLYDLVWMPIVDFSHLSQNQTTGTVPMLEHSNPTVTPPEDHRRSSTSTTASTLSTVMNPQSSTTMTPMNTVMNPYNSTTISAISSMIHPRNAAFSRYWTEPMEKRLEELRSIMPWYSVVHPLIIDPLVVRFVRERWHFKNKPILVVLDPQGRELSPNAIHMMWIWGTNAFPFTSMREEALWRDETWRLELLVSGMDPIIDNNWIKEGKHIILYGGEDIDWIRRFTTTARSIAQAVRVPLEMAYVGKSNKREMVRKAIATIMVEKLSYCWQDPTMIWYFWARLESMFFSKIQVKKTDDMHQDPLLQEIKKLLSYDKSGGWALLCKGSYIVAGGHAQTVLSTFQDYDAWKENVPIKGFEIAFKEYHDKLHVANLPCCRFEFSTNTGRIPDGMRCPECLRHMDKYNTFICCHDDNTGMNFLPY